MTCRRAEGSAKVAAKAAESHWSVALSKLLISGITDKSGRCVAMYFKTCASLAGSSSRTTPGVWIRCSHSGTRRSNELMFCCSEVKLVSSQTTKKPVTDELAGALEG